MLRFIAGRLIVVIAVTITLSFITFFLLNYAIDPAQAVAGEGGGPITVPEGGSPTITPDGTVFFNQAEADPAAAAAPPVQIGQMLIRDASGTTLQRRLDGLYEQLGANGAGGDIAPGPEAASLSTGALEGSNVNPVEVLVNLMDYYRSFETQMKLVKSAEELDQTGTRLMQTS